MLRFLLVFALSVGPMMLFAQATPLSDFVWRDRDPAFGGLSAIEVSDDGTSFVAIGDRGVVITGMFERTNGSITGVQNSKPMRLLDETGAPLSSRFADSEGIAIDKQGTIYISFEARHGVRRYHTVGGNSSPLLGHPDFAGMQVNSSLEALAIGPNGAIYTMPERSGRATRPFPVYRMHNGLWDQPFAIPRRGAYLMVGADVGPDNRLYVLERDFTGLGFRSRVRRFDLQGGSEETILKSGHTEHDNLEGISVWRATDGGLRITMIADDNFRFFQQTEIVEYRIDD